MTLRNRTLISVAVLGLLGLMLATYGCSSGTTATTTTSATTTSSSSGVSFSKDIQPIFTSNCVVCHTGSAGPAGLTLDPGSAYKDLVNVKSSEAPSLMRVAPGSPDKSYLVNKLLGTQASVGGTGAQMPFGASPLPQTTINKIQQWISAGAPNN